MDSNSIKGKSYTEIREQFKRELCEELVNVQPMPSDMMQKLLEVSVSEEELDAKGYRPVSCFRLLWIKE